MAERTKHLRSFPMPRAEICANPVTQLTMSLLFGDVRGRPTDFKWNCLERRKRAEIPHCDSTMGLRPKRSHQRLVPRLRLGPRDRRTVDRVALSRARVPSLEVHARTPEAPSRK